MRRLVREIRRQASVRGRLATVHGRILRYSRYRKAGETGNTNQTYTLEESSLLDREPRLGREATLSHEFLNILIA